MTMEQRQGFRTRFPIERASADLAGDDGGELDFDQRGDRGAVDGAEYRLDLAARGLGQVVGRENRRVDVGAQ